MPVGTIGAMAARTYRTEDIEIEWYPERCVHAARCIANAPEVFDPQRRPWIIPEAGTTEQIITAIEACPTGALRYRRSDGVAEETTDPAQVFPVPNGPLVVRGELRVLAEDGSTFTEESRLAFCRCGNSANQPFCDNSHREVEFESKPPTPAPHTVAAEGPDEICPPQSTPFTE